VRTNNPDVVARLGERLPPGWAPADSPFVDLLYSFRVGGADARRNVRNYHLLYFGMVMIVRTMNLDFVFDELEGHLQPRLALLTPKYVFVHAGVVAWRGRAIVLPGYSRAGKSTLVAELLKLGATYYSDEYAVLDGPRPGPPLRAPAEPAPGERPAAAALHAGGTRAEAGSEPLPVGWWPSPSTDLTTAGGRAASRPARRPGNS